MRVIIAFDVDGTLESSSGPVKIDRLHELEDNSVEVWIVSPSGLSPNRWATNPTHFKEVVNGDRVANLKNVKSAYPWPERQLFLYVSDNKDYDFARQAGFSYIEATQFV